MNTSRLLNEMKRRPIIDAMTFVIAVFLILASAAHATSYQLVKDYMASDVNYFFASFDFFSGADPTNGFVQYLDRAAAVSSGLAGYMSSSANSSHNSIYIAVDSSSTLTPYSASGRPSIRIYSKDTLSPGTLIVADILHAPTGICGTWPAFWLLGSGSTWPAAGEVDIFEQVSLATRNAVTLHTGPGCALVNGANTDSSSNSSDGTGYSGSLVTSDCYVYAADQVPNAGCRIAAPPGSASFGVPFNEAGGGIYVAEWKADQGGFAVWFFPRCSAIPPALLAASSSSSASCAGCSVSAQHPIDTETFGVPPIARFAGPGCSWDASFRDLRIIFNTGLCGDWAGGEWVSGGCAAATDASTCEEFVAGNPGAFEGAYWELASLRVYGSGGVRRRDWGGENAAGG